MFNLGLGLMSGGGGKHFYLPGDFDARWVINGATPDQVYTRSIWLTILGAGAISVTGTTEWSDDGVTFTADPGTIATGKLWVRDTASSDYSTEETPAVVNGGVVIDTVDCPMVITSMVDPATLVDVLVFGEDTVVFGEDRVTF